MSQNPPSPPRRLISWLGAALLLGLIGFVLFSLWPNTLAPLIEKGDTRALVLKLVGMPILFIGAMTILYGGYVFGRDTTTLFRSERYQKWERILRGNPNQQSARRARIENLRLLWQNWQTGLAWVAAGLSLFVIGHFLTIT